MVEVRCERCGKLLGMAEGKVEIKCSRCDKLNKVDTESHRAPDRPKG